MALKGRHLNYALWIFTVALIAYFKFFIHEMWKDEWQAWFVARDLSIPELLKFLYYEGHPSLWYLYLKPFTWLSSGSHEDKWIQVAHLLTVTTGLYLLFIRFRMSWWMKWMMAMTYFVFFEYGIVNRGYFWVILIFFWIIIETKKGESKSPLYGWAWLLLCQTEVYGVFMATGVLLYMFLVCENKRQFWTQSTWKWFAGGVLLFVLSVFPRTSDHLSRVAYAKFEFTDKIAVAFQGNLSNTYLLGSTWDTQAMGWTWTGIFLSGVVLAGFYITFKGKMSLFWTMCFYVLAAWMFSLFFHMGGVRHWGMGFVFFIGMVELRNLRMSREIPAVMVVSIMSLFAIWHGFKAAKTVMEIPFSNARQTGTFIREKVPASVPVVTLNKFESVPVSGYAGRNFYELPDGTEFSYFRWVDKIYVPTESELRLFAQYKGVGGIVLISPTPIDSQRFPNARFWQSFDKRNYKNENYYLYSISAQ